MLLTETFQFRPLGDAVIVENAASGKPCYRRTGVVQNYVRKNANNRIYPKKIWEDTLKEGSEFHTRLKGRQVVGLLEHPKDGITRLDYGPALLVTEAKLATDGDIRESKTRGDAIPLEEGDIVGTIEFLNTHNGKELRALDEAGIPICVSSRGVGDVAEKDGAMIVENFKLETWDAVWSPSVQRAVLTRGESVEDLGEGSYKCPKCGCKENSANPKGYKCAECGCTGKPEGMPGKKENFDSAGAGSPPAPAPVSAEPVAANPKTKTPMSKLNEFRQLESRITALTCTNIKGLKVSQRASLLSTVTETQVDIDRLVQEDPSLKTIAHKARRRLSEFEDNLNTDEPPAPPADVPKAAPTAPPGEEPQGAESATSDDVRAAAEHLQSSDDPAAAELAPKLNALADELAAEEQPDDAGGPPAPGGPPDDAGGPPAPAASGQVPESKYNRLLSATSTILERYNALKKSNQADGLGLDEEGAPGRKAATQLLGEKKALETKVTTLESDVTKWESAARDLAEKYNQDMIEMGTKYWQTAKPALFEKVKDQLTAAKTFDDFTAITEKTLKEETDASAAPAAAVPKEEPAAPAPAKDKAEPKGESMAPKGGKPLDESVQAHPALAHVRRARQFGSQMG